MDTRRTTRGWVGLLLVAAMVSLLVVPAGASASGADRQAVELEIDDGGEFTSGEATLGWSRLTRRGNGLEATVHVEGLRPGGVFTFWWVVPQDDATFPDDIFVGRGAGTVVGENGKATVHLSADVGDAGISGFPVIGDAEFASLHDPLGALVRVEIAYHGQASLAGDDLDQWLGDFWSGAACPASGDVNAAGQPHCPVYIAATHPA
jgi:hypothetical protein